MNKITFLTTFTFLLVSTLLGCLPSHLDPSAATKPDGEVEKLLFKTEPDIEFADVQRLVFSTNCTSCHNSKDKKDNVDLTSYAAVTGISGTKKVVTAFDPDNSDVFKLLNVTGKRLMPPEKAQNPLSEAQKKLVYEWIKNGAKEFKKDASRKAVPIKVELAPYFASPEKIDYGLVQKYVLSESCTKCHSINGEKPDYEAIEYSANLTDYASIFGPQVGNNGVTNLVTKGDPEKSTIYSTTAIHQHMPPQDEDYPLLDSYRLKLLRLWILNCAIEDYGKITNDRLIQRDPSKLPDEEDEIAKVRLCDGQ